MPVHPRHHRLLRRPLRVRHPPRVRALARRLHHLPLRARAHLRVPVCRNRPPPVLHLALHRRPVHLPARRPVSRLHQVPVRAVVPVIVHRPRPAVHRLPHRQRQRVHRLQPVHQRVLVRALRLHLQRHPVRQNLRVRALRLALQCRLHHPPVRRDHPVPAPQLPHRVVRVIVLLLHPVLPHQPVHHWRVYRVPSVGATSPGLPKIMPCHSSDIGTG